MQAFLSTPLHGQVAGQHVAGVVENDIENALSLIRHPDRIHTRLRSRCSEDISYDRDIHHSFSDKSADRRLMARSALCHDRYAVRIRKLPVYDLSLIPI